MQLTATQQKVGYILLTSATLHANNTEANKILLDARTQVSRDMTLPTLIESIELIESIVYPRFASAYEY